MKLKINKKTIFLYSKLFLYILISGFVLFISKNVIYDILAFIILVCGAIKIVKYDIAHPYVWYSFTFMLYSISYPILYINDLTYDIQIYTKSLMFSQWLSLVTFLIVVSPIRIDYLQLWKIRERIISSKKLQALLSLIIFITIFEILRGDFNNKSEIYASNSMIIFIGFRAALVFLAIYTINLSIVALEKSKIDVKMSVYVFITIFLLFFFSGERDLIIRYFIILLFIYYIIIQKTKISKEIILMGLFSLTLIPILGDFKYFGLTGQKSIGNVNFFFNLLSSEFGSASKNMQILLLDKNSQGIFKGYTFFSAILRTFNLDKLLNIDVVSSVQWFNDNYFMPGRAGQGFTIVGDGFINFGYAGIIIIFLLIGIMIKIIYLQSNKGIYKFVFYILSIPIFMYSIRADLNNILSSLIKQDLLVIIFVKFLSKFIYDTYK